MKLNNVLTLLISLSTAQVQAGQIPSPDGVLGGVSTSTSEKISTSRILVANAGSAASIQRDPNHLRGVVENSGICGQ